MLKTEALILNEQNLKGESYIDVNPREFMKANLVLFIDKEGQTTILKNRYGDNGAKTPFALTNELESLIYEYHTGVVGGVSSITMHPKTWEKLIGEFRGYPGISPQGYSNGKPRYKNIEVFRTTDIKEGVFKLG